MASSLRIVNPLEYPEWDKLLLASPGSSFFHSSSWARVLCDSFHYLPCYLLQIEDGKILSLIPLVEIDSLLTGKRGVSLPFTDYCDPIASNGSGFPGLYDYLRDYGKKRKWKYIEYRGGVGLSGAAGGFADYYRHVLPLSPDSRVVFNRFRNSRKRNIRKAEREGVTVVLGNSLSAVETFYRLHCITRRRHGMPPQPFEFFRNIHEHIISKDRGMVALANYQGRPIAGAVFLHFGQEAIFKFGASLSAYLHLRPNDLLLWSAIKDYCIKGYRTFCFGRTEPDNEGLRQFKHGWGAHEKLIHYYRYDVRNNAYRKEQTRHSGIAAGLFRILPLIVTKWLGKVLYRHVG